MQGFCLHASKVTRTLTQRRCGWLSSRVVSQQVRGFGVNSAKALPRPPDAREAARSLRGRKAMEDRYPIEGFTIAGVTFNGRQEIIRQLAPDQIVYLEREPWNEHDPMAVRVVDLSGRLLGYIPRRDGMNARFKYEGAFGMIASVGPAKEASQYGARLYARPKLASLILEPLPLSTSEAAGLEDLKGVFGNRWTALRVTTLAAAGYCCEVTGVGDTELPLEITPQWRYNSQDGVVQLTRLVALCAPVAATKARLEKAIVAAAHEDRPAASALQELLATPDGVLFTEINGFSEQDTLQYFEFVRERSCRVTEERWRVEILL